ncbi:protein Cripto [Lepus europaeus]|uniref:protein Cripto n=1 Tax=Lepus europaeus TaxID=9983 RepID=UPI002B493469|nr:protein Cripto [Lepus europaeus]
MERLSSSVILIVAISNALDLGFAAGSGHREPLGDLASSWSSSQSQEEPAARPRSSHFVSSVRIQDSKQLNKSCCLNGGTCMLGSFCACPPSFSGRNCEVHRLNCGRVPHDTWLPKRCSMCKCWQGELHCFSQPFLPGCEGRVVDKHPLAARTPASSPAVCPTWMLAGICLAIQSSY